MTVRTQKFRTPKWQQATWFPRRLWAKTRRKRTDPWTRMVYHVIVEQTFGGIITRDHAIAVFRKHNDEVRRTIPAERLLLMEAGAGWDPLCRFPVVAPPDASYPRENTTEKFQARRAAKRPRSPEAGG